MITRPIPWGMFLPPDAYIKLYFEMSIGLDKIVLVASHTKGGKSLVQFGSS